MGKTFSFTYWTAYIFNFEKYNLFFRAQFLRIYDLRLKEKCTARVTHEAYVYISGQ